MRARPRAVVIGGGIGGIAAALVLADRGHAVTLIEAAPRLAAGWHSVATPAGPADLGIRVPRESGDARADALVFHDHPGLAWHRLGRMPREGHVAAGRLNPDTACLDARALPPGQLGAARAEVFSRAQAPDPRGAAPHLAARLEALFGRTLLEVALRPACRALLGAEPETLAWNAAEGRLPARIVLAPQAETDSLHRFGLLASRLAHPRAADARPGDDPRSYLYPAAGGIGAWIAALDTALRRAAVDLRLSCRAASLAEAGGRIAAVTTQDGAELPCDQLVLAAAPRALPLPWMPEVSEAGLPVTARLLAVAAGAPPPLDWIVSYDPAMPFIRLGFPDRLEGRDPAPGSPWRIIAETRPDTTTGQLVAALASLGVLPTAGGPPAETPLGTGRFVVETLATRRSRDTALAALAGLRNLVVLRSATGGHALAHDLVADAARLAHTTEAIAAAA